MTQPTDFPKVSFIGYGEAARAFVAGWAQNFSVQTSAYDIKSDHDDTKRHQLSLYQIDNTLGFETVQELTKDAAILFSLVTADQALFAAETTAQNELDGAFYFDCNSCAPQTKQQSSIAIEGAGGRYVDVAIMAPVHPKRHKAPVLISGPHTKEAYEALTTLDMDVTIAQGPIGTASAIKLCRSIVVKGLEAISLEMILSARQLGVEQTVLTSLDASYPGFDWGKRTAYTLDRMMAHGQRRSAEMAEAANMLDALGLPAQTTKAMVATQQIIGELGLDPGSENLSARSDLLLAHLLPLTD